MVILKLMMIIFHFTSVALGSGSEGTNNTFDIVIQSQDLDATSRTGNITLEFPELTTQTISVHQDDNDAHSLQL